MKKEAVLSLGGSIMVPDDIDVVFLKQFKTLISEYVQDGWKFVIITGGGKICRKYQAAAKELNNATDLENDLLGIDITKVNARLIQILFKEFAHDQILGDPSAPIQTDKPVIVGAGYEPGWSTDYDSTLVAENLGYDMVINLSNIRYVYDKDPNKFEDAKPLTNMTWSELENIVGDKWHPGLNAPFDPTATKLCKKLGLSVYFIDGRDLQNFRNLLNGKAFEGTTITP